MMNNNGSALSHRQNRIWLIEKMHPGTGIANLAASVPVSSEIPCEVIQETINRFLMENEWLRMQVREDEEGRPQRYIAPYSQLDIPVVDLSQKLDADALQKWSSQETTRPFALTESRLFKLSILKGGGGETRVYGKLHQLIADRVTVAHVLHQIQDGCATIAGASCSSGLDERAFADHEDAARMERDRAYWLDRFSTLPDPVLIKRDQRFTGDTRSVRKSLTLSDELSREIESFCKARRLSAFAFFLSAYYAFLYKNTGRQDFVVGTSLANRTHRREKAALGLFENVVPFRFFVEAGLDFASFCRRLNRDKTMMLRHQKYPFDRLASDIRERQPGGHSLYQIGFEYQEQAATPHFSGAEALDLVLHVRKGRGSEAWQVDFDFRCELFDAEEMQEWSGRFLRLLQDALRHPDRKIADLEFLSEREKQLLLVDWNLSDMAFPDLTFLEMFVRQAEMAPDRVAVVFRDREVTYRELHQRSQALAHLLREKGIGREQIVGLMVERSVEMLIAVIAVLKAGGAYLPIDPDYPAHRIEYMLSDSRTRILLTQDHLVEGLHFEGETVDVTQERHYQREFTPLDHRNAPEDLAYVIYTSGSTGNPKGVMIEHRSLNNIMYGCMRLLEMTPDSRVLHYFSISFDVSVVEIFPALAAGAAVVLETREALLPGRSLLDVLENRRVSIAIFPSSALALLPDSELSHLQVIASTAEPLPLKVAQRWSGRRFVNLYGPTESTVFASFSEIHPNIECIDIGRPLPNYKLYILDDHGNPVPIGCEGELHVSGPGVARGYLNRPQLTAEKFIPNPFQRQGGSDRIYKTGDLARFLPDGRVECLGRIDHQVKIRGYRIELGEIENWLGQHPDVRMGIAMVKEDQAGDEQLVAYVASDVKDKQFGHELRSYLQQKVPEFMIPAAILVLDEFPLLPSGKIDRSRLPLPEFSRETLKTPYVAPRSSEEELVTGIWREVLRIERVGVYDNFFEMGGNSPKLVRAHHLIEQAFGRKIAITELFRYPTIQSFVTFLQQGEASLPARSQLSEQAERKRAALERHKQVRKNGR